MKRWFLLIAVVLGLLPCSAAEAQDSIFTNVAPVFRPGPYSFLRVDATNPDRFVVGTPDGWVMETRDGGKTTTEVQALSPRIYFPMVLRGTGGNRGSQFGRSQGRGAHRLFMSLLHAGLTTTRWATWMAFEDPSTEIFDIAPAPIGGHGALAGPNGVFVSDERMGSWVRAIGFPRPKGNVTSGFSVAWDPSNKDILFAGTSDGLFVSKDAGQNFARHPDKKLKDGTVRAIVWNQTEPDNVLLLAGETIYKSENHGQSFEAVLNADGFVNGVASADEGVYVATATGLSLYGSEGTKKILKSEPPEAVVGVVPAGKGAVLAATETQLYICDADGKRAIMSTNSADPFIKLVGTADNAWALTKYGIFHIGTKEARAKRRSHRGPELLMTLEEVQRATLKHLAVGDPGQTRLNDRWYAALMPTVTVDIIGGTTSSSQVTRDGTLPTLPYRASSSANGSVCCSGVSWGILDPSVQAPRNAMAMAHWDLAKIVAGPYGNVTMPNSLVESGLRDFRVKVLEQVRWRYREVRNLCALFRFPPTDPETLLAWQMRLEEHAQYLEAITGKKVVALDNMEDPDDD